ncbi:MAG: lipid II flippase MurJ [Candidatus Paceibacterota bacterium]
MFKRILFFLSKKITGLHQAAYIIGFFTLLSQVLGLVRDRLLAYNFGADTTVDIYYAAFRIPDIILVVAGSVVSISVLVPFLTKKISQSKEVAEEFIDTVFTIFFIGVITICIPLYFLMPNLIPVVFPGITDAVAQANLIFLARLFLLSPILLGLSNIFASIIQVHRRFLIYAISPLLYNLGIIIGIVALYPYFGITGLGLGVVLGVLMHVGIQLPFIIKKGFVPRWFFPADRSEIWKVVRNSLPRTFTLSIDKLALLFLVSLASLIGSGSIAIFNYAWNLQSVPMALVGASYSLAAFPVLSQLFADGDMKGFMRQVQTAIRHVVFWSLPILSLFIVLRAQIVRTILGAGEFGWLATRLTAASLSLFVISVVAQSLVLVLVRAYYAADDTMTPLITSVIGGTTILGGAYGLMAAFQNIPVFRFFLENLLRVRGIEGTGVLVLPLAYSLGMVVMVAILWYFFQDKFGLFPADMYRSLWQSAGSAIVGGFVAYGGLLLFGNWLALTTGLGIFLQGFLAGITGIAAMILTLWLMDNQELEEMWQAVRERYWHVSVEAIGPAEQQ